MACRPGLTWPDHCHETLRVSAHSASWCYKTPGLSAHFASQCLEFVCLWAHFAPHCLEPLCCQRILRHNVWNLLCLSAHFASQCLKALRLSAHFLSQCLKTLRVSAHFASLSLELLCLSAHVPSGCYETLCSFISASRLTVSRMAMCVTAFGITVCENAMHVTACRVTVLRDTVPVSVCRVTVLDTSHARHRISCQTVRKMLWLLLPFVSQCFEHLCCQRLLRHYEQLLHFVSLVSFTEDEDAGLRSFDLPIAQHTVQTIHRMMHHILEFEAARVMFTPIKVTTETTLKHPKQSKVPWMVFLDEVSSAVIKWAFLVVDVSFADRMVNGNEWLNICGQAFFE